MAKFWFGQRDDVEMGLKTGSAELGMNAHVWDVQSKQHVQPISSQQSRMDDHIPQSQTTSDIGYTHRTKSCEEAMRRPFPENINELDDFENSTRAQHIRVPPSPNSCDRIEHPTMESVPAPTIPIGHSMASMGDLPDSDTVAFAFQRTLSNKDGLDPGLFARDRNPRRKATKLFGEPPSPQIQRHPKSKPNASSTTDVGDSTSVRSRKRKPHQDYHWPSERRRKRSRKPDLSLYPHEAMDENDAPAVDKSGAAKSARIETQSIVGRPTTFPPSSEHLEPMEHQYLESRHLPIVLSGLDSQLSVDTHAEAHAAADPHPDVHVDATKCLDMGADANPDASEDADIATFPGAEHTMEAESTADIITEASQYTAHTSDPGSLPDTETTVESTCVTEAIFSQNPDSVPNRELSSMPETPPFIDECRDEPELHSSQKLTTTSDHISSPGHLQGSYNPLRRPTRDTDAFLQFGEQMKSFLRGKITAEPPTVGTRQARRILSLLEAAKPPDEMDAAFVSGPEATQKLASQYAGVIVTEGQQLLPLQTVDQFLGEYYNARSKVWIQDPSSELTHNQPSVRQVTIARIRKRFAAPSSTTRATPSDHPWNLLELATHCDDGLRPAFLNDEDCRLLTKLKIPNSDRQARRRTYSPGYKEVEKWALLAQAGALTEPHQDSHGYATFITINYGVVGFGWLSRPSPSERAGWCARPHEFLIGEGRNGNGNGNGGSVDGNGGNAGTGDGGASWRYIVLHPGQTVYFPSGTVHFVFRHPATGDSLAFGGHVLRCTGLVRWVRTMLEEKRFPNITNEDITASAPGYLTQVEKFVKEALQSGEESRIAKWGGRGEIEEFLRLKKKFLS